MSTGIRRLLAVAALLATSGCVAQDVATTAASEPSLAPATAGVLAAGTPSETPWFVVEGEAPGPVVVLVGGVHGDEPAGAAAAEEIRHWPLLRGKLVVVPRANVTALAAGKRLMPGVDEALSNLNRNFPKAGESGPARGPLATALWEFVSAQEPAWVVDLHEGIDFERIEPTKSVGSSVIVFPTADGREAAAAMLDAVNATIDDPRKAFARLGPPVDGSLARAAGEHLHANAMIVETTTKGQPLSLRTRQHRIAVRTLLLRLAMIDESVTADAGVVGTGPAPPRDDPRTPDGAR